MSSIEPNDIAFAIKPTNEEEDDILLEELRNKYNPSSIDNPSSIEPSYDSEKNIQSLSEELDGETINNHLDDANAILLKDNTKNGFFIKYQKISSIIKKIKKIPNFDVYINSNQESKDKYIIILKWVVASTEEYNSLMSIEKQKRKDRQAARNERQKEQSGVGTSVPTPSSGCGPSGCIISGGKTKNKRNKKTKRAKTKRTKTRRNRKRR